MIASGLAIIGGCGAQLPMQPTVAFGEGVTLYPDSLYRGERVTLGGDVADLSQLRGPCQKSEDDPAPASNYDDCVSSLRVPSGWTVTVFRDRGFAGASATYSADVPDLDVVSGPCKPGSTTASRRFESAASSPSICRGIHRRTLLAASVPL